MIKKTKRSLKWISRKNNKKGNQEYAGIHIIAEFWNGKIIEDKKEIRKILIKAVEETKSTPLEVSIHKFQPQGITGVVLLAESHIAIHSWPEINYLAIDIFTCGEKSIPYEAIKYLRKIFQPERAEIKKIKRGMVK